MSLPATRPTNLSWMQHSEVLLSAGLLVVLGVMLVPLPPILLDMLLASNLALTVLLSWPYVRSLMKEDA